jgi:hypothetical protein
MGGVWSTWMQASHTQCQGLVSVLNTGELSVRQQSCTSGAIVAANAFRCCSLLCRVSLSLFVAAISGEHSTADNKRQGREVAHLRRLTAIMVACM